MKNTDNILAAGGGASRAPAASREEMEHHYAEISALYDLAEELLNTVDSKMIHDPEAQLDVVAPLAEQLTDSAEILGEELISIAKNPGKAPKTGKTRIENALRKLYMAFDQYKRRVGVTSLRATDRLHNIADPIVRRVKQQIEQVVAVFARFMELSLERIMSKLQVEQIRVNQPFVALMMHRMGQQH